MGEAEAEKEKKENILRRSMGWVIKLLLFIGVYITNFYTFSYREFYDNKYFFLKIGFVIFKTILIFINLTFYMVEQHGFCYFIDDFFNTLKIHEVFAAILLLFIVLHVFDIFY